MNISLPNGKVVRRSIEEYLFLEDSQVDLWYQKLMADDAGDDLDIWSSMSEVNITEFPIPENPEIDN